MNRSEQMKSNDRKQVTYHEKSEQVDFKVIQIQNLFSRLKMKLGELSEQYIEKGKKIYKDKNNKQQN